MTPAKGFRFYHSRVLDGENRPMLYIVTKIARGTIYYRPVSGGSPDCCPIADFGRAVMSKIQNSAPPVQTSQINAEMLPQREPAAGGAEATLALPSHQGNCK